MSITVTQKTRRGRRRRYPKTVFSYSKARAAQAKINKVSAAIAAEMRYNQVVNSGRLTTTAGTANLINGLVTGHIDGTRNSAQINIRNIKFNLELWNDANAGAITTSAGTLVRVMLVRDLQPNSAIFANADLLDNNGSAALNYIAVPSFVNRKRFRILYDKIVDLQPQPNTRQAVGGTTYEYETRILRFNKSWKKMMTQYIAGAGAGTVADIIRGSVYLVIFPETANTCQYTLRAMYTYDP